MAKDNLRKSLFSLRVPELDIHDGKEVTVAGSRKLPGHSSTVLRKAEGVTGHGTWLSICKPHLGDMLPLARLNR